jgi:hypothetical protein
MKAIMEMGKIDLAALHKAAISLTGWGKAFYAVELRVIERKAPWEPRSFTDLIVNAVRAGLASISRATQLSTISHQLGSSVTRENNFL